MSEISDEDFSSVLTNGFDTLLSFDSQGRLVRHETLEQPSTLPQFAPYRQGAMANWARDGRVALVLNRLGEILILKDGKLLFARRSGRWHFLTHESISAQMGGPQNLGLRQAVYESCLDASFARTGACIGLITSTHAAEVGTVVSKAEDRLSPAVSVKAKAVARMVDGKTFQQLDRRLRQELLAIDGATVLTNDGGILAVGAILRIEGGSTGGGRLAAARALAQLGVGIKVSQDGGIQGFRGGTDKECFVVM
jgi:hypothetical protein